MYTVAPIVPVLQAMTKNVAVPTRETETVHLRRVCIAVNMCDPSNVTFHPLPEGSYAPRLNQILTS